MIGSRECPAAAAPSGTAWPAGRGLASILRRQLVFLQTQIGPNEYTDLREFLMNE